MKGISGLAVTIRRVPLGRIRPSDKNSPRFKKLEHVLHHRAAYTLAGHALVLALTGSAYAAEVTEKIDVDAAPDSVWAAIGDFCGIKEWHPVVTGCDIKSDGDDKIRTLTIKDSAQFVEKQTAWDDAGKSYTYMILTSPLPLSAYTSTIGVAGSGMTSTITWTGSFTPNAADGSVETVVSGIYKAGLEGLKSKIEAK